MMRVLILSCATLATLCGFQWKTIRELKGGVSHAAAEADSRCAASRADELSRLLVWLDGELQAQRGAAAGLCRGGTLDRGALDDLVMKTYLQRRAAGGSEIDARDALRQAIAPSDATGRDTR